MVLLKTKENEMFEKNFQNHIAIFARIAKISKKRKLTKTDYFEFQVLTSDLSQHLPVLTWNIREYITDTEVIGVLNKIEQYASWFRLRPGLMETGDYLTSLEKGHALFYNDCASLSSVSMLEKEVLNLIGLLADGKLMKKACFPDLDPRCVTVYQKRHHDHIVAFPDPQNFGDMQTVEIKRDFTRVVTRTYNHHKTLSAMVASGDWPDLIAVYPEHFV